MVRGTALAHSSGRDAINIATLCVVILVVVLAAETESPVVLFGAVGFAIIALSTLAIAAITNRADLTVFLIAPTIMSAFQNAYLSPAAGALTPDAVRVVIVVNFIWAIALYGILTTAGSKENPELEKLTRRINIFLIILLLYGAGTALLFQTSPIAAIASARNVVAPLLFTLLGLYASQSTALHRYLKYLIILGFTAVAFGVVEYIVPNFWPTLGLHHLWELKGLEVTPGSLLPRNFYASEQLIPGEFIRRMAGPFADPVNFGTFLFATLMAAWFLKNRFVAIVGALAVIVTVSKGALLGALVSTALWAKFFRSRFEYIVLLTLVALAAFTFYGFTQSSSTGSTTAHINGLLAAFTELPQHPLGRGLGGVGVLTGLFSDEGRDDGSGIAESGLGLIMGQLGIVGLLTYIAFFGTLLRAASRIDDVREKVLVCALTLAFAANAAFNEVALSPNSCAPYFVMVGLALGRAHIAPRSPLELTDAPGRGRSNVRRRRTSSGM